VAASAGASVAASTTGAGVSVGGATVGTAVAVGAGLLPPHAAKTSADASKISKMA